VIPWSSRAAVRTAASLAAAALVVRSGRFGRRAAMRAGLGAATTVLARPVPSLRRGPAAALAAAATGAAVEAPAVGAALAIAAAVSVTSRPDALAAVVGAAAGLATTRVWPTAPRTVAELRRHGTKATVPPSLDGDGVVLVVNAAARAAAPETADAIRSRLPSAVVVEPDADGIEEAPADAGGDGTLSAAARLAHDRGVPLVAVPAGTLNHFARDLGVLSIDDAMDALQSGAVVHADLAEVGDQTFVNTASFGAYTDLVDARERLEGRIGKWPAVAVALLRVLRRAEPIELAIDGHDRRLWLGFVGCGTYHPSGFAPTWREVLDDGLLDIRLVDAAQPWARTRLVLSVLTGRLGASKVYEQPVAPTLHLRSSGGPIRIALDGETCDVDAEVTISKRDEPLLVHAPHR
jgi:diacylglycerol kinase family enzyme